VSATADQEEPAAEYVMTVVADLKRCNFKGEELVPP
jgi:hypothetical protein